MKLATMALACAVFLPAQDKAITDASNRIETLLGQIDTLRYRAVEAQKRLRTPLTPEQRADILREVEDIGAAMKKATDAFHADYIPGAAFRKKVLAAARQQELKDSIRKLKAIEKTGEGENVRAYLMFHLAECTRLNGEQLIKTSRKNSQAVRELRNAIKHYEAALKCKDMSASDIGTSVHASSMRHLVQIHAMLFDAYSQQYRASRNTKKRAIESAKEHRTAGIKYRDMAMRIHREATSARGTYVVDDMAADVARLTGTNAPAPRRSNRGGRSGGRGGRGGRRSAAAVANPRAARREPTPSRPTGHESRRCSNTRRGARDAAAPGGRTPDADAGDPRPDHP